MLRTTTRSIITRTLSTVATRHGGFCAPYGALAVVFAPTYKPNFNHKGNRFFSDSSKIEQGNSIGQPPNQEPLTDTLESGNSSKGTDLEKATSEKDSKKNERSKVKRKKKSKAKKKSNTGNEHIVAALAKAINEDDWPNIIRYSTLDPQNLEWWHPDDSEWLAGNRMGIALSVLTKNQWKQVLNSKGIVSTHKLAQVLAKKHMGQIDYLPNLDDPDEIQFYKDWGLPLPFDWWKNDLGVIDRDIPGM
ncbi:hypothetical protein RSOLAG1IB_10797 [Rhizoctonia solani AG-1 IB]|uniref:Uncharacterized protein n=1 Tax=Thanatephorus cucumeris (strain AG1-IB / isolate 7/3/14) TaxID=1108050 RepID=A0A0B7G0J7_THACB|nr:hypothetical protein RSOLAG1IB_10797 [Rhizoctonia solani AG-1 IB]